MDNKGVDPNKLKEENPNDPRIGQGYNDARGEIPEEDSQYKNRKNNTGPEQKRDLGVQREINPRYTPAHPPEKNKDVKP